jgi:hypothetical protein
MDLTYIEGKNVDWVCVVQDKKKWRADVKTILNFRAP